MIQHILSIIPKFGVTFLHLWKTFDQEMNKKFTFVISICSYEEVFGN